MIKIDSFYLESSFGTVDRGHDWFIFFWKLIFPPKFSVFILDHVCDLKYQINFWKFSSFFEKVSSSKSKLSRIFDPIFFLEQNIYVHKSKTKRKRTILVKNAIFNLTSCFALQPLSQCISTNNINMGCHYDVVS